MLSEMTDVQAASAGERRKKREGGEADIKKGVVGRKRWHHRRHS